MDEGGEDRKQRVDRELSELLNELRVEPGVQVIFGLLLPMPFAQRFGRIDGVQRLSYLGTLVPLTLSSLLLIARPRSTGCCSDSGTKEGSADPGDRYARAGLVMLLAALSLGLFFVVEIVCSRGRWQSWSRPAVRWPAAGGG